jgi:hypothetical protein
MDHNYEMASYDRTMHHIHDKDRLSKPLSYWKSIAPTTALEEANARGGWEHPDVLKAMKKAGKTADKPTKDNMWNVLSAPANPALTEPVAPAAAAESKPVTPAVPAAAAPAPSAEGGKAKFDKQAMLAKIREKKAK